MTRTAFLASLVFVCLILPVIVSTAAFMRPAKVEHPQSFCRAIEGDTIVCGKEHIRLNGIDAPEMHPCPADHKCAPGDPILSKDSLSIILETAKDIRIDRLKTDNYGRTVAEVTAGSIDLSCWQLDVGAAEYKPEWDERGSTRRLCHLDDEKSHGNSVE